MVYETVHRICSKRSIYPALNFIEKSEFRIILLFALFRELKQIELLIKKIWLICVRI